MERDNKRKNISTVWEYFIKKDGYLATCKVCHNDFSYRGSVSNLRKHLVKKHKNLEITGFKLDTSDSELGYGQKWKQIWSCFTKKDNLIASCNACNKDYNYGTNIANLKSHWMHQHVKVTGTDGSGSESEELFTDKPGPTWKYFDIPDSDKFIATCKVCRREITYNSMSDLTNHMKEEHDVATNDSEDEVIENRTKKRAAAWQFFKCIDKRARIAMCLICLRQFSYHSSVTNLMKHVKIKHPNYKLVDKDEQDNTKFVRISSDGQLFEIDTGNQGIGETDDERDPIEMDTVYLEDFDSSTDQIPQEKIKLKKEHNLKPKAVKRLKLEKEQIPNISQNNRFSNNRLSISSDEEFMPKKPKTEDSLNCFGKYIISLLKDLPKNVSEHLQGEIIKQIITTKVALQSTLDFSGTNNGLNENNQVTVTISTTDTNSNVENNKNDTNAE